jgi:DNA-binding IclR family transcriptional regulator
MKPRSTNERNGSGSGTQAVDRALAILHALGDGGREPGLTDLADALGLHKTTVFRLLGALERGGFVERDSERQSYRLGSSFFELATQARRSVGLHEAAGPELHALALETGEAVTLELLVGDEVLILDEVRGRFLLGSSPEVGTRWPAHATSTGKMLLAAARYDADGGPVARHDTRHDAHQKRLERRTASTITTRAALDRELAEAWRRGYAIADEELEVGFVAIGAPVRDAHGRVVAAISVGGPKSRVHGSRIAQLTRRVRAGADAISRRLGAPAPPLAPAPNPPRRSARTTHGLHLPTNRPVA